MGRGGGGEVCCAITTAFATLHCKRTQRLMIEQTHPPLGRFNPFAKRKGAVLRRNMRVFAKCIGQMCGALNARTVDAPRTHCAHVFVCTYDGEGIGGETLACTQHILSKHEISTAIDNICICCAHVRLASCVCVFLRLCSGIYKYIYAHTNSVRVICMVTPTGRSANSAAKTSLTPPQPSLLRRQRRRRRWRRRWCARCMRFFVRMYTCVVIVVCAGLGRVVVVDGVEEVRRSGASEYP